MQIYIWYWAFFMFLHIRSYIYTLFGSTRNWLTTFHQALCVGLRIRIKLTRFLIRSKKIRIQNLIKINLTQMFSWKTKLNGNVNIVGISHGDISTLSSRWSIYICILIYNILGDPEVTTKLYCIVKYTWKLIFMF